MRLLQTVAKCLVLWESVGIILHAGPFTPGNLMVYRVGDGISVLTNTGNPVFLDEYTTNGVLVQSIMLPTNWSGNSNPLIASGTATSEGLLTRSPDGRFLALMGYGTTLGGTIQLANSSSFQIPRVVAIVDHTGAIDTSTALTNFASGNNPRSAVTVDGTNIWVSGAGSTVSAPGGVAFTTRGSTFSIPISTNPVSNVRQILIFSYKLYVSSGATGLRIGTVGTGLPTNGLVTMSNLPGIPTSGIDPYAFVLFDLSGDSLPDLLYVADPSSGAGIIKYSFVNGLWISNGVIKASQIRGLTASATISHTATNIYLYGTTGTGSAQGGGAIYAATDSGGYNAPPTTTEAIKIAEASPRTAFRGIAFAPIDEAVPPIHQPVITSIQTSGPDVIIRWTTSPGLQYYIEAASQIHQPNSFERIAGPFLALPGEPLLHFLDAGALTNHSTRFYRIVTGTASTPTNP